MNPEEYRELAKALRTSAANSVLSPLEHGPDAKALGELANLAERLAEWEEKQEDQPALDPKEALERFGGITDLMRGGPEGAEKQK